MRRKLATVLMLAILLNIFGDCIGVRTVYAAVPGFYQLVNGQLSYGQAGQAPTIALNAIPADDELLMAWDFSTTPQDYKLTYNIAKDTRAILTINKTATNVAAAKFEIEVYEDGEWKQYNDEGQGTFQMYDVALAGVQTEPFLSAADYIKKYGATLNAEDKENRLLSATQAAFTVTYNGGFSFKYKGVTIHFRWNQGDNRFYFQTSGLNTGILHNIALENKIGASAWEKQNKSVFLGIDLDTMMTTPTANNALTARDHIDLSNERIVVGDKVAGIKFSIPTPVQWSSETRDFTDAVTTPMVATFELSWSGEKISFKIDNVNSDNPKADNSKITNLTKEDGIITFEINGLEPSTIFSDSQIQLTGANITSRDTEIPFGRVFTFMKYDVVPEGEKYRLRVYPYNTKLTGYYMLRTGSEPTSIVRAATKEWDPNKEAENYFLFPLSLNALNPEERFFQILFSLDRLDGQNTADNKGVVYTREEANNVIYSSSVSDADSGRKNIVYSQISYLLPSASSLSLNEPTYFEITKHTLSPKEGSVERDKADLDMTISFDLGPVSNINSLVNQHGTYIIEYDLRKTLTPMSGVDPFTAETFTTLTLKLTMDTDGSIVGTAETANGEVIADSLSITSKRDSTTGADRYSVSLGLEMDAVLGSGDNNNLFYYPNVYFVNLIPVRAGGNESGLELTGLNGTNYDSMSLSDITLIDVAQPQNITAHSPVTTSVAQGDAKDETSFKVTWDMPAVSLSNYVSSFTFPAASATAVVNLYISQSESDMKNILPGLDLEERRAASVVAAYNDETEYTLYFSSVGGVSAMETAGYSNAREALRAGKIVTVADISLSASDMKEMLVNGNSVGTLAPMNFTFDGLDKNQKYYVYADIVVTVADGTENEYSGASLLSALVGITTMGDKLLPTPDEKIPGAPTITVVEDSVTMDSATLEWNDVEGADEDIEYQIIRLTGEQMLAEHLDKRDDFSIVWGSYIGSSTGKQAFMTSGSQVKLYTGGFTTTTDNASVEYGSETVRFTDNNLSSNQLYFYYVRAVKMIDGIPVSYSVWSRATVTSKSVGQPTNLKVLTDRDNYDKQTEAIINFNAPIQNLDQLGSEFTIWYQLKAEGEEWDKDVKMDENTLRASAVPLSDGSGYNFTFKIPNLKPGTSYTVRVKIEDKNKVSSLYSNSATIRTEMNQGEYDDEQDLDTWTKYYQDELKKLLLTPFWTAEDTTSQLEIIYRPSMFGGLISAAVDGYLSLYSTSAPNGIYYIPASSLIDANGSTKALKLTFGNLELIIPASTIDMNLNSSIIDIGAKIKDGTIKDYYIKLTVNLRDVQGTIDGYTPATKQITVRFDLVGIDQTTSAFENAIHSELMALISNAAVNADFTKAITSKIKDDTTTDEEILKYIDGLVAKTRNEMIKAVSEAHKEAVEATYFLAGLNKNIILVAKLTEADLVVNGYEYSASLWTLKETTDFAGGRAIYVKPGTFTFVSRKLLISALEGMKDAGVISSLIAKYGLEDYFGRLSQTTLEQVATRDMIIGAVARMSGAPKTANAAEWLNTNKKLGISSRNGQSQIQTQEALYLLMSLYEIKSNTKVSAMAVRNYGITAGVANLEDKYKAHIRAAHEIGLHPEKTVKPTATLKVKDILAMLGTLDRKVKL